MSECKPRILTIFTPAYNRAALLPRLFDSIDAQVPHGSAIEWLVIDDGSSDDTTAVLAALAERRPDLIRFVRVENGGKHRAINRAARISHGRWVMIVDSDDMLHGKAVQSVLRNIEKVDADASIGVLRGLKEFPELGTQHQLRVKSNPCSHTAWLSSQPSFDTAEVIRASALRLHPFPDHAGERFMAEGWLWHSLEKTHLTQFVNEPWITCFYQTEGLSSSSRLIRARSPKNAMAVYSMMLSSPLPRVVRLRCHINWWRYWLHARLLYAQNPGKAIAPIWTAPMGWWLFRQDRKALS